MYMTDLSLTTTTKGMARLLSASIDVLMRTEQKSDLDMMAEGVQNLFGFKHFYDHIDFT